MYSLKQKMMSNLASLEQSEDCNDREETKEESEHISLAE